MEPERYKLYDKLIDFFLNLLMITMCIFVLGLLFAAGAICYKQIFTAVNCKIVQVAK